MTVRQSTRPAEPTSSSPGRKSPRQRGHYGLEPRPHIQLATQTRRMVAPVTSNHQLMTHAHSGRTRPTARLVVIPNDRHREFHPCPLHPAPYPTSGPPGCPVSSPAKDPGSGPSGSKPTTRTGPRPRPTSIKPSGYWTTPPCSMSRKPIGKPAVMTPSSKGRTASSSADKPPLWPADPTYWSSTTTTPA